MPNCGDVVVTLSIVYALPRLSCATDLCQFTWWTQHVERRFSSGRMEMQWGTITDKDINFLRVNLLTYLKKYKSYFATKSPPPPMDPDFLLYRLLAVCVSQFCLGVSSGGLTSPSEVRLTP